MPRPKPSVLQFESIGTHWWIEVLDRPAFPKRLAAELRAYADVYNQQYSRFIPTSLIGRLNSGQAIANPPSDLLAMMDFSREMHDVSQGAFDITVGGLLHGFGYGAREGSAPINQTFWQNVTMNKDIIQLPAGTVIDTGGFGKGWLIDRFVAMFAASGVKQFIINGGGDLYVSSHEPVIISLEHPLDPTLAVGTTPITQGALGVSSPYKRSWEHEGKQFHHLIDPETGEPSTTGIASTYVRADTALMADTMASVLLLRPELNDELCERYGLRTILLHESQLS